MGAYFVDPAAPLGAVVEALPAGGAATPCALVLLVDGTEVVAALFAAVVCFFVGEAEVAAAPTWGFT